MFNSRFILNGTRLAAQIVPKIVMPQKATCPLTLSHCASDQANKHRQRRSRKFSKPRHQPHNDGPSIPDAYNQLPHAEPVKLFDEVRYRPKTESAAIVLTAEETYIGIPFLKRIITELESRGQTFVLPWADEEAMNKIVNVLGDLTGTTGVLATFLADAFIEEPKLFAAVINNSDLTVEILDIICDMCGFSVHDAMRVFGSYSTELLLTTGPDVIRRLETIIDAGIEPGRQLGRVVRRCPGILFAADPTAMKETVVNLNHFFSRPQIIKVLLRCPEIALRNFEETESKYEYIYYQMGIQPDEFVDSSFWSTSSLEAIIDRHTFLLKTGKYTLPDPKRPQIKMENPPLYRILDSRHNIFATQVAKVTPDEWTLYQELSVKLAALEDKDRPFERIKPSMRKAYERRLKQAPERENFMFE